MILDFKEQSDIKVYNKKPWGYEKVLVDDRGFKVKIIVVDKGKRTSLQYHKEKREFFIFQDSSMRYISEGEQHRLTGPLEVIEFSFGEDSDIIRLQDDYGRS